MEQLKGLWRDTWWLWCVFFFISIALAASTSWVVLVVLPCLSVSFCYFAYIRYDEDGNEKGNYGFRVSNEDLSPAELIKLVRMQAATIKRLARQVEELFVKPKVKNPTERLDAS